MGLCTALLCSVKIPAWPGQNEGPSHPQLLFSRFGCAGRCNKLLSPEAAQLLDPAGGEGKRSRVSPSLLLPMSSRSCPSNECWGCGAAPLGATGPLQLWKALWQGAELSGDEWLEQYLVYWEQLSQETAFIQLDFCDEIISVRLKDKQIG